MGKTIDAKELEMFEYKVSIYFYLKARIRAYNKELRVLKSKLENEANPKGITWESIGSGCSARFPKNSPLGKIREAKINIETDIYSLKKQVEFFENYYHVQERYEGLSQRQKNVIYSVYIKVQTKDQAAHDLELKSKTYIYEACRNALISMMEMEV